MSDKTARYLKILDIELQDLVADIDLRIQTQQTRKARGDLSEYVFKENIALLTSERHALDYFIRELERLDSATFQDVRELEAAIEKKFISFLVEHEFPHAIESFVTRKMRKILQFCQCD